MASATSIPAFLLPRGLPRSTMRLRLRPRLPQPYPSSAPRCNNTRNASSTSSSSSSNKKSRSIPQPDKFRPPSHPARRVMQNNKNTAAPRNYGAPLTKDEIAAQKTKQYPNMFPPEGTVMHRFLTNKGIHVWISMSVLVALATFTWSTNFKQTSPFAHLLPSWGQVATAPIASASQFVSVMKMHSEHRTLEASEKRKRISDDVVKRREYRLAHGLARPEEMPVMKEEEGVDEQSPIAVVSEGGEERNKPLKKWFGIW